MKKIICTIAILYLVLPAFCQTTWYVSPTGSNSTGNGSFSNPWATPQYALGNWQLNEGDTVILRGGNYLSDEIRIDLNNITLKSYPGEWAILTAPVDDEDIGSCLYYHNVDMVGGTLERLEIIGGYYYGIKTESNWNWGYAIPQRHGASNIKIKNCRIHDTGRDCIKITPASDNLTIESCEIYNSGIGPANLPVNNGPNAEGIDAVNADNLVVKNCYFHNISTNGVYSKGGSINSLIEGNLVVGCGVGGILLGFYTDEEWFDTIANPLFYENLNGVVRNNIIINTANEGLGIYGAFQPAMYNNTVINCGWYEHASIFFNTGFMWLDKINDMYAVPSVDVFLQNNIVVQHDSINNPAEYIRYYDNIPGTNMLGNCNINYNRFYRPAGVGFVKSTWWQTMNLEEWHDSTGFDANSWIGNPLLDNNYHLSASSPCINTANSISGLVLDYDGGTRTLPADVGADEYNAGNILTIPPPAGIIGTGAQVGTTIPATATINTQTIQNGQVQCFNATQLIAVAGNGNTFTVNSGGSAKFISGGKIIFYPGVLVHSGGYLLGTITTNGTYCSGSSSSIPSALLQTGLINEKNTSEPEIVSLFPNPFTSAFTIELSQNINGGPTATVEIFGIHGELLVKKEVTNQKKCEFLMEQKPAGLYIVKITTREETLTKRLVKL